MSADRLREIYQIVEASRETLGLIGQRRKPAALLDVLMELERLGNGRKATSIGARDARTVDGAGR